jgi:hypothetical protein
MVNEINEAQAPGWWTIDAAFSALYSGQTPHQFSSKTPYQLDSANPLPAITVWEGEDRKRGPFWHYVTYGLSELFEKTTNDPDHSGMGFELTLRVLRSASDTRPPGDPLALLQFLGGHILAEREGFDTGNCVDLGAPLAHQPNGEPSRQTGFICVPDPALSQIQSPFGRLVFLALVSIEAAEREALLQLNALDRARAIAEIEPLALCQPDRRSWLDDPELSKVFARYRLGIRL